MSNEKSICPICGKPTYLVGGKNPRKDGLCGKHSQQFFNKLIYQCPDCGKWIEKDQKCDCKITAKVDELPSEGYESCILCGSSSSGYAFCRKCFRAHTEDELLKLFNDYKKRPNNAGNNTESKPEENDISADEQNGIVVIDPNNKSKCLVCGKQTDGLLFCQSCYHKYKNKKCLFKISKCSNVELLDDDYEGWFTCKDGHVVKSKSEREIDNYLFDKGIFHVYEKEVHYGAKDNEVLHPDFYLPKYLDGEDVYIEHWGFGEENTRYTDSKNFKIDIYKKKDLTVVCTFEKDMGNIESTLERKLDKTLIKLKSINFDEPAKK